MEKIFVCLLLLLEAQLKVLCQCNYDQSYNTSMLICPCPDDVNITYTTANLSQREVHRDVGQNVTFECKRSCEVGMIDNLTYTRWLITLSTYDDRYFCSDCGPETLKLQELQPATITATEMECKNNSKELLLTIEEITPKLNGATVECRVEGRNELINQIWYDRDSASFPYRLVVNHEDFSQVTSATILPVLLGKSVTLNCSRICGPQIINKWKLHPKVNNHTIIISQNQSNEDFAHVTFTLSNGDYAEGCDGELVQYSLTIGSITEEVDGLTIECGIQNIGTGEELYGSHTTILKITENFTAPNLGTQSDLKAATGVGFSLFLLLLLGIVLVVIVVAVILLFKFKGQQCISRSIQVNQTEETKISDTNVETKSMKTGSEENISESGSDEAEPDKENTLI